MTDEQRERMEWEYQEREGNRRLKLVALVICGFLAAGMIGTCNTSCRSHPCKGNPPPGADLSSTEGRPNLKEIKGRSII